MTVIQLFCGLKFHASSCIATGEIWHFLHSRGCKFICR